MTRFEILGRVAARQDDWAADLPPQQQLLLAVLVMAGGAAVARKRLEEALWGAREPYPEHGVEKAAYELRKALRRASPEGDPVPAADGGYRLLVTPEQADILRFRAKADTARCTSGPASLERMREALREWGPDATGLHGGEPLRGLAGQWADNTRHRLRMDHRKAVLHCLTQGTSLQDYDFVLRQCEQLDSDDVKALLDEKFAELWIRAAAGIGDWAGVDTVVRRAAVAATRAGQQPGSFLSQLVADLKAGSPIQAHEANYEVSAVDKQNPGDDACVRPATGQQAEPGPTVHNELKTDQIAQHASAVGIDADPGPGFYENKAQIGSIEGEYTGVRIKRN